MMRRALSLLCLICPVVGWAEDLTLPGRPVLKVENQTPGGTLALPIGAFEGGAAPVVRLTGNITHRVFQSDITGPPSAILGTLSEQLTQAGYDVRLACIDRTCGGFDFRYSLPIMPPPAMYVDLGNFAFISGTKDTSSGIMIIASQSPNRAHVQITEVIPPGSNAAKVTEAAAISQTLTTGTLSIELEKNGFFILSDLIFKSGASSLDGEEFTTLADLAEYLLANPHRTIALVGHTDATGSLDGNIALSKKRAGAVRRLLVDRYGVNPQRVAAEGMGYLAPVAPNTTELGREQNRRVEVIILPEE